jgi:hypothetical protein
MSLLDIRQQFVAVSGRYDLVVDANAGDWTDAGANFYINAGQMYLDQKIETKMSEGVFYKKLSAGSVGCAFPDCRAVREVWRQDLTGNINTGGLLSASDSRTRLTKRSKEYLRAKYPKQLSSLSQGGPSDYYLPNMRIYPDQIAISQLESYLGWLDIPISTQEIYNGIIVLAPPDHDIVLEIVGLFFTPKFVNDTDETIWSLRYPTVLLWAALRELEITYRNTEGAKDWENAISSRLIDIDKDNVEETIADVDQMEG